MYPLLIILIGLVSIHKAMSFYFWHDDFSTLYQAVSGNCSLPWPYTSYCAIYSFLYKTFGLNEKLYFGLGVLAFLLFLLIFFSFLKNFYDKKSAFLATSLLAVNYLGLGIFFESYDSITSFVSMGLYILSLKFLFEGLNTNKKSPKIILSLSVFSISVLLLQARSSTYIFPYVALVFLFSKKVKTIHKILFTILSVVLYYTFFKVIGSSSGSNIKGTFSLIKFVLETNFLKEFITFVTSLGGIVFIDLWTNFFVISEKIKLITGTIILVVFAYSLYKKYKSKDKNYRVIILGVLMSLVFYLPYALRYDGVINSNHRYLWPFFVGTCIIVGGFLTNKFFSKLILIFVVLGIVQSNYYFGKFLNESNERKTFYSQLKANIPKLKEGSLIFIDSTTSENVKISDFLRVGALPSESAISVFSGNRYQDLKLVLDKKEFTKIVELNEYDISDIYVFNYFGGRLENYTNKVRDAVLKRKVSSSTSPIESKSKFTMENKVTTSSFSEPGFKIDNFEALFPSKIDIVMKATIPDFQIPYHQNCTDCTDDFDPTPIFNYLTISSKIKQNLKVTTSNSWEGTKPENLTDNDESNYWVSDRPKWFEGQKPKITIDFPTPTNISGLILTSSFTTRRPSNFEVIIDNSSVKYSLNEYKNRTAINFENKMVKKIDITITETSGGENPAVEELEVIPGGFVGLSQKNIIQVKQNPAAFILNQSQKIGLANYLKAGVPACVKWNTDVDSEMSKEFRIAADGNFKKYSVIIPSMEGKTPTLKIGCINFPMDIYLSSASVSFLGNNKN